MKKKELALDRWMDDTHVILEGLSEKKKLYSQPRITFHVSDIGCLFIFFLHFFLYAVLNKIIFLNE